MIPRSRALLVAACCALALPATVSARGADLSLAPLYADGSGHGAPPVADGGGGFRVGRLPVRPVPLRFDVYGYPLLPGAPNPLAVGNGCPPALQPAYDAGGNFAGYAPIPLCR